MIQGYVDKQLQAKVSLAVLAASGHETTLVVVVDSGFNGELCISMQQIKNWRSTTPTKTSGSEKAASECRKHNFPF